MSKPTPHHHHTVYLFIRLNWKKKICYRILNLFLLSEGPLLSPFLKVVYGIIIYSSTQIRNQGFILSSYCTSSYLHPLHYLTARFCWFCFLISLNSVKLYSSTPTRVCQIQPILWQLPFRTWAFRVAQW